MELIKLLVFIIRNVALEIIIAKLLASYVVADVFEKEYAKKWIRGKILMLLFGIAYGLSCIW